jgi:membrane protein
MLGLPVRQPITTDRLDTRQAAKWTPRLLSAALAALLLALGAGRKQQVAEVGEPPQPAERLTAKTLLLALYQRVSDDRIMAISAGVTFFALLAIFPAIGATVSTYGLFADLKKINADLSSLAAILPGGAIDIVGEQIKRIAAQSSKTLGAAAIGGILFSIWSANAGMKALFDALNIVLKEKETRGFFKLNAVSLAFTAAGLLVATLAIVGVVAVPAFLKSVGWNRQLEWLIEIGRWPVLWALLALGIAVLYRFGPGCTDIPWRWISWGSGLAAFGWLVASMAFSWYAANYGSYNKTYGSLGAGIGLMTWIWISVMVILMGEELNEILDAAENPEKRAKQNRPHPLGIGGPASSRVGHADEHEPRLAA